jgi:transcriptional regulator with XRE-family HTH domain
MGFTPQLNQNEGHPISGGIGGDDVLYLRPDPFHAPDPSRKLRSVRGADPIREARTRAGLTQDELAERSGIARSLIARWEQGEVSPSVDNFLAAIEACGFEIPLVLAERDASLDDRLDKNRHLSPERRARRLLTELEKRRDDG